MLTSEAIKILQDILEKHGDCILLLNIPEEGNYRGIYSVDGNQYSFYRESKCVLITTDYQGE